MEGKQKICCTVESCQYNDQDDKCCTLKKIEVTPTTDVKTKESDESMCSSYKCCD